MNATQTLHFYTQLILNRLRNDAQLRKESQKQECREADDDDGKSEHGDQDEPRPQFTLIEVMDVG